MKKIYSFLLFLFSFFISANSQWMPQGEGVLPQDYTVWSISIVDEDILWAVGSRNDPPYETKVIKSTDGGEAWLVYDLDDLEDFAATSIVAISDSMAFLSLGDEQTMKRYIYRTLDGGNSWQVNYEKDPAWPNAPAWPPAVKFLNKDNGFFVDIVAWQSGYTHDGGNNWTVNDFDYPDGYWNQVDVDNWWDIRGDTLIWATSHNFMRSTNKGQTWEKIATAFPDIQVQTVQISESGIGLASGDVRINPQPHLGLNTTYLQRTDDGGASWIGLDQLDFPITALCHIPGTDSSFMGVSGYNDTYVPVPSDYQPTSALTNNGGESWVQIDTGIKYNTVSFLDPETGWAARVANEDYVGSNPALLKWTGGDVRDFVLNVDEVFVEELEILPNPASYMLHIKFPEPVSKTIEINLYDFQGKLMNHLFISENQAIVVKDLPPGIYLLKAIIDKKFYTGKFMKQ